MSICIYKYTVLFPTGQQISEINYFYYKNHFCCRHGNPGAMLQLGITNTYIGHIYIYIIKYLYTYIIYIYIYIIIICLYNT